MCDAGHILFTYNLNSKEGGTLHKIYIKTECSDLQMS